MTVWGDVVTMKEEAGILEVDNWSERSGVEVCVLVELEVGRKCGATNGKVTFEGFKRCIADRGGAEGTGELVDGANNVDCSEQGRRRALVVFRRFSLGEGLVIHGTGQVNVAVLVVDKDRLAHLEG